MKPKQEPRHAGRQAIVVGSCFSVTFIYLFIYFSLYLSFAVSLLIDADCKKTRVSIVKTRPINRLEHLPQMSADGACRALSGLSEPVRYDDHKHTRTEMGDGPMHVPAAVALWWSLQSGEAGGFGGLGGPVGSGATEEAKGDKSQANQSTHE